MDFVCVLPLDSSLPLGAATLENLSGRLRALCGVCGSTRLLACIPASQGALLDLAEGLGLPVARIGEEQTGQDTSLWPRGSVGALAAARTRFPDAGLVLADALRPGLTADVLHNFLAAVAHQPDRALFSLHPCRDHPCQMEHFFRLEDMLALARPEHRQEKEVACDLASASGQDGCRWVWSVDGAGRAALRQEPPPWPVAPGPERMLTVHAEVLDGDGQSLGRVMDTAPWAKASLNLGPLHPEARRLLVCLLASSPGDFHFSAATPEIRGLWRHCEKGLVNEQTGCVVTGRQDFPALYLADGLLAFLPAGSLPLCLESRADLPGPEGQGGFLLDQEPLPRLDVLQGEGLPTGLPGGLI